MWQNDAVILQYLSNLIFQSTGDSGSIESKLIMPPSEVLSRLRIKSSQYEAIAEKALIWMNKLSEKLSFE